MGFKCNSKYWLTATILMLCMTPILALQHASAASIHGQAFLDRDCDGVRESNEPALSNWMIYLRGQVGGLPPVFDSTTTTPDGVYFLDGLSAGDYSVSSGQQTGYVQNSPVSVDYRVTLSSGQAVTDYDFSFKVIATCDTSFTSACEGGVDDYFSDANGPEPSSPSTALLAQMNSCGSAIEFFDEPATDACFGHTFTGCWGTCGPISMEIQMRLRASSAGSQDDELHFGDWPSPGSIWHISLSTLLEIQSGGADVSWDPGDTMTVTLDLANLPVADRGLTSIMAALYDGDLDIYVKENTEVDFASGGFEGG